ncbi:2-deoxy-D-gluconate 3-dehydrogenase [Halobacillus halophilus]|uniref:Short-chain dehydrogenase/reductase family protein n=1 Tax=Halobacillus halophilus (strain ATCC 35676 / DSM 2266 / JCM 20832 / KCTC 3685 / LMG 17431 / NBRC 102448 / NCIMB 2269) TaxID=866895 RepID=I0JN59_HALH3|nr:glucose 1-dehydrogenase [Halobacillus halophilus]ASF39643.1 2-deoxy-D-gluconate 3-dehydrogenase [Halobacillus halophilus]CCG45579.1 short-chain dehydrogenase/reductase family protein [Halobacillus halophilus DSM 2266]
MYLPDFRLDHKLAVVTGGTKGIGKAIALAYAESGADVILIARNEKQLKKMKETVESLGQQAYTICKDIQQYDAIKEEVEEIRGDRAIDIWVNNAGMNIRSEAENVSEEEWDQIVSTNMKSAFFLSQYAGRVMKQHRQGKIINISSVGGHTALRTGVVYAMTKSALIQMTKNLALEWGKYQINVNAIGPWYFPTSLTEQLLQDEDYVQSILERTPLNRIGKLEEVSGAAVFLASDAGNYMTGQTLFVDGGMTIYGF